MYKYIKNRIKKMTKEEALDYIEDLLMIQLKLFSYSFLIGLTIVNVLPRQEYFSYNYLFLYVITAYFLFKFVKSWYDVWKIKDDVLKGKIEFTKKDVSAIDVDSSEK